MNKVKFPTPGLKRCNCGHVPMHVTIENGKSYVQCSSCENKSQEFTEHDAAVRDWNKEEKKKNEKIFGINFFGIGFRLWK